MYKIREKVKKPKISYFGLFKILWPKITGPGDES